MTKFQAIDPLHRSRSLGILGGVLASLLVSVTASAATGPRDAARPAGVTASAFVNTPDEHARSREAVIRDIADQQIGKLKQLVDASNAGDRDLPDLLFRLADDLVEKREYFQGRAAEPTASRPRADAESRAASAQAIAVYERLVGDPTFANYERLDEALYLYALELAAVDREEDLREVHLRLIREFPNSKFVAHSYRAFADYHFAGNRISDALQLYQKIVDDHKGSPVYAHALFQIAWCNLDTADSAEPEYGASLQQFVAVVDATLAGGIESETDAASLRRRARRELVTAYVHAGDPATAWSFFARVGNGPKASENMAPEMMELLAVAYFDAGMFVESAQTYKTLKEMTRLVGATERPAVVVSNHRTHARRLPQYFSFASVRDGQSYP